MSFRLVAQPVEWKQTGGVFFRSDNQPSFRHGGECLVDGAYVPGGELVMVAEGQRCDVAAVGLQVYHHLPRGGDAGEQEDMVAGAERVERHVVAAKDGVQRTIFQGGEEERLIGV